jgi:hypothetical protein
MLKGGIEFPVHERFFKMKVALHRIYELWRIRFGHRIALLEWRRMFQTDRERLRHPFGFAATWRGPFAPLPLSAPPIHFPLACPTIAFAVLISPSLSCLIHDREGLENLHL